MFVACTPTRKFGVQANKMTAQKLLGNVHYQGICYGGYRTSTRDVEPTVAEIKDDLKILAAMNIKFVRTYNVHHKEVAHLLEAITELKKEDAHFPEMSKGWYYVCYEGLGLGWVKNIGKRYNNYLPKECRIRMDIRETDWQ